MLMFKIKYNAILLFISIYNFITYYVGISIIKNSIFGSKLDEVT